jgi:hypothetical protein
MPSCGRILANQLATGIVRLTPRALLDRRPANSCDPYQNQVRGQLMLLLKASPVRPYRLSTLARGVVAVAIGVTASVSASAAVNLQEMAGYWTGTGKIVLANGNSESVKCVVTYKVTGAQLKQNVRCAGQGYSLNGTADLIIAPSGAVTGSWTENTYAAKGDVIGKTTDKGFSLAITGPTFTAVMDATTTACKQSLDIVPKGLDVSRISLGLGKC